MVFDVVRALGRRWYVVVVGLLVTAGLVFGAYRASPPEYNARALVLLLPPRADVGKGGNPFLLLSGLEQPAGILAAYFSSAPARSDVEAISPTAEYEVGIDDSTRGPVIAIDVTDESPADTLRVLSYLLQEIPGELARLQEDVDTRGDAVVGSMDLTVDRAAEPDLRGTIRLMIAALVVGIVGTGFAAVALDGFLLRRRQGARSRALPPDDGDVPDEPTSDEALPVPDTAPASTISSPETTGDTGSEAPADQPTHEDHDDEATEAGALSTGAPAPAKTGEDGGSAPGGSAVVDVGTTGGHSETDSDSDGRSDSEEASSKSSSWSW